jgi:hypothetical protein
MNPEGKVQVVVRSRRVPIGTVLRTEPVYSLSGLLVGYRPIRSVLFGTSLDEDHRRTIEEAQKLAHSLGMGLEVVDESKSGLLSRFRSALGRGVFRYPSVVVSPSNEMMTSDTPSSLSNGC